MAPPQSLASFNAALRTSVHQWAHAMALFADMQLARVEPSIASYEALMQSTLRSCPTNRWQHALTLLNAMESMHTETLQKERQWQQVQKTCDFRDNDKTLRPAPPSAETSSSSSRIGTRTVRIDAGDGLRVETPPTNTPSAETSSSGSIIETRTIIIASDDASRVETPAATTPLADTISSSSSNSSSSSIGTRTVRIVEDDVLRVEMYAAAIEMVAGEATLWQRGLKLLSRMQTKSALTPTVDIYGTLIRATAQKQEWQQCLSLFHRLHSSGVVPSSNIMAVALQQLARHRQWEQALRLSTLTTRKKTRAIYAALIAAVGRAGRYTHACDLMHEMEHSGGFVPDNYVYSVLVRACPHWEEAARVFNTIREPNVVVYNALLAQLDRDKMWQHALALLTTMEKRATVSTISYNTTLSALAHSGQWEHALALFHRMPSEMVDRISLGTTIGALWDAAPAPETGGCCFPSFFSTAALQLYRAHYPRIVNHLRSTTRPHELDLHHFTLSLGKAAVVMSLEDTLGTSDVIVVVGTGRKSTEQGPVLHDALRVFLTTIGVSEVENMENSGRLRIPNRAIRQWREKLNAGNGT